MEIIVEDTEIDKYLTQFDDLLKSNDGSNIKMAIIMLHKSNYIKTIFDKSDLFYIKQIFRYKFNKYYFIRTSANNYISVNISNDVGNLINEVNCQLERIDKYESIKNRNLIRIHERNAKTL